jgi:hypothetical protein
MIYAHHSIDYIELNPTMYNWVIFAMSFETSCGNTVDLIFFDNFVLHNTEKICAILCLYTIHYML